MELYLRLKVTISNTHPWQVTLLDESVSIDKPESDGPFPEHMRFRIFI